ncbi:MAG: hypothetical protein OXC40_03190 [Proteobacteria bacterium]|nr:hypothetical protein [Pseudomonadota bacterium]
MDVIHYGFGFLCLTMASYAGFSCLQEVATTRLYAKCIQKVLHDNCEADHIIQFYQLATKMPLQQNDRSSCQKMKQAQLKECDSMLDHHTPP